MTLPVVRVYDEEESYNMIECGEFISGSTERIRSDMFTDASIRSLPKAYHILHKDDFTVDGVSEMNACVLALFKKYLKKSERDGKVRHLNDPFWKNNILVVKAEPGSREGDCYEDICITDATEVVKFLYMYTSCKGLL